MSKLFKFIAKIFSFLLKGELSSALYNIALVTPNWFFRFNKAFIMYTEVFKFPDIKNRNIKVKIASESDLDDIIRISELDQEKILYMLKSGITCFLASDGENHPASITWSATGKCFIRGMALAYDFGNDGTYGFWSVTLPEARGKGLHYALMAEKSRYDGKRGRVKAYGLIEAINQLSYDMRIKTGFKPLLLVYYLKLFFIKVSYVKNLVDNKRRFKIFVKEPIGDAVVI